VLLKYKCAAAYITSKLEKNQTQQRVSCHASHWNL
jgi:hypothetical protein